MNDMSARRCKQGKNKIYIFSQKGAGFKPGLCKNRTDFVGFPEWRKKGSVFNAGQDFSFGQKDGSPAGKPVCK